MRYHQYSAVAIREDHRAKGRNRTVTDQRRRRRLIGRAVIATVLPVGLVSATASPALAEPTLDAPPEAGASPVATLPLVFPATQPLAAAPTSTAVGPLAAEI